jgi:hypothetical protein
MKIPVCGRVFGRTLGQLAVGWVKLHDKWLELLGLQDAFPSVILSFFLAMFNIIAAFKTQSIITLQAL